MHFIQKDNLAEEEKGQVLYKIQLRHHDLFLAPRRMYTFSRTVAHHEYCVGHFLLLSPSRAGETGLRWLFG